MTSMVDVYYKLVKAGMRDIDSVPEQDGLRVAVQAKIQAEGTGS